MYAGTPSCTNRFAPDPEGGAYYAYSDEQRLRELVRPAEENGFDFDD